MKFGLADAEMYARNRQTLPLRIQEGILRSGSDLATQMLLKRQDCDPSIFQQVFTTDVREHLTAIAQNTSISHEVQTRLIETQHDTVVEVLAENPALCPDIFARIFREYPEQRRDLAWNPNLPAELLPAVLNEVIEGSYRTMGAAHHQNLPEEVQERWARAESIRLREYLAKNPYLSTRTQLLLTQDSSPRVWGELASNPHTGNEALQALIDLGGQQRSATAGNPALSVEQVDNLLKPASRDCWTEIARREDLTLAQQHTILRLGDMALVEDMAYNVRLDRSVQEKLLYEGHDLYLAHNPYLHPEIQAKLVESADAAVHRNLSSNEGLTQETYHALLKAKKSGGAVYQNSSMVLGVWSSAPLGVLARNPGVERVREELGADPEIWDSLLENWKGTLGDLAEACKYVTT